jgi:hypothetical protein
MEGRIQKYGDSSPLWIDAQWLNQDARLKVQALRLDVLSEKP